MQFIQNADGSISETTTTSQPVDIQGEINLYNNIVARLTAIGQQIPAIASQITTAIPALSVTLAPTIAQNQVVTPN